MMMVVAIISASMTSIAMGADQKPCQQKDDLFSFKDNLGDGPYFKNWTESSGDCCNWTGVTCNFKGFVTAIVVTTSDTSRGNIPDNLAKFTALETLVIGYDLPNISGPIPNNTKDLVNLKTLKIVGTNLSGQVPEVLGQIPNLNTLVLSNDRLAGGIESLANAPKLEVLDLSDNQLSSPLPTTLPPALKILGLGGNKFAGEITADIANKWSSLEGVNLSNNQLSGSPQPLFTAGQSSLRVLYLGYNQFSFNMSAAVLPTGLIRLDLSHNQIYWTISQQVNDLQNLTSFSVSNNQLFGEIPSGLSKNPASAFDNNLCLCGTPLKECPCCLPKTNPTPSPTPAPLPASGHVDLLHYRFLPLHLRRPYA